MDQNKKPASEIAIYHIYFLVQPVITKLYETEYLQFLVSIRTAADSHIPLRICSLSESTKFNPEDTGRAELNNFYADQRKFNLENCMHQVCVEFTYLLTK